MNTLQMEEKLWAYIDGTCTPAEQAEIEALIGMDPWKAKYTELVQLHQLIHLSELEEPSMRFTQNVMEEISRYNISPAATSYINKKVIYGIGIFFVVMIAGLLVYGLGQIDWSSGPSTTMPLQLDQIAWNRVFNNTYTTIFMMVNIILGLMLLDGYLNRKRAKGTHRQV